MATPDAREQAKKRIDLRGEAESFYKGEEYKGALEAYQELLDLQTDDSEKLRTLLLQAQCGAMLYHDVWSYEQEVFSQMEKCRKSPELLLTLEDDLKQYPIATIVLYSAVTRMYVIEADAAEKILRCLSKTSAIIEESSRGKLVISIGYQLFERMIDRLAALNTDGKDRFILDAADIADSVTITTVADGMNDLILKLAQKMLQVLKETFGEDSQNYYVYGALLKGAGVALWNLGPRAEAARYFHRSFIAHSKAKDLSESKRRKGMTGIKEYLDDIIRLLPPEEKERVQKEVSDAFSKLKPTTPTTSDEDGKARADSATPKDDLLDVGNGIFVDNSKCLRKNYSVYLGRLGDQEVVAVKRLPHSERHKREVQLMLKLKHENTVRYRASSTFMVAELRETFTFFAMDLCDMETLHEIVQHEHLSEEQALTILLQITHGLRYIHENSIVHGDLKPQNILLSLDRKNIKIADFGLSKQLDEGQTQITKSGAGTDGWTEKGVKASAQSDIYSAGLVFFYVLTRKLPFVGGNVMLQWLRSSPDVEYHLMSSMVQDDRTNRPLTTEVLKHPLFWGDKKKLDFISDVSDSLVGLSSGHNLIQNLEQKGAEIFGHNWRDKLSLTQDEVRRIRESQQQTSSKVQVSAETVQILSDRLVNKKKPQYDKQSLKSLIRFIRNQSHHFLEGPEDAKTVFTSHQDIFSFFASRFPRLFPSVYDFADKNLHHSTNLEKYFNEEAKNKSLNSLWTAERRLKFMEAVAKRDTLLEKMRPTVTRLLQTSWLENLKLSPDEVADCQKKMEARGNKRKIEHFMVHNKAIDESETGQEAYDPLSVKSLFKFIWMRKENCGKEGPQFHDLFESDRGIWKFFSRRHPGLFEAVHEFVKNDGSYNHIMSEVHVAR